MTVLVFHVWVDVVDNFSSDFFFGWSCVGCVGTGLRYVARVYSATLCSRRPWYRWRSHLWSGGCLRSGLQWTGPRTGTGPTKRSERSPSRGSSNRGSSAPKSSRRRVFTCRSRRPGKTCCKCTSAAGTAASTWTSGRTGTPSLRSTSATAGRPSG